VALRVEDIDLAADRALVERWQAGEHEAFDDLYRRYFDRLRSYCQRRVGDRDTAEELAQEAFVKALQALPRFAGEKRFYPWVTVIANRLCVDHHRRNARVRPVEDIDPGVVDGDHGVRLAFLADVDNLDRALQRLGPRHAQVLDLRERKGMTYAEIADHLAVPQSTVEALLFRARKALRREFFAVAGDGGGRLASLPVLGILVRRLAALRGRTSDLLPTLSQLGGPVAAGAVAAVLAAPFGGGAAPSIALPTRAPAVAHVTTTSLEVPNPMLATPPAPITTTHRSTTTTAPPSSPTFGFDAMSSDDAAAAAADMPVNIDEGPLAAGADPLAVVAWLRDAFHPLQEDDE
jgi:RNA polymerase sigma-70 factor (ECF subfamily)